jgi:hypothetical protein
VHGGTTKACLWQACEAQPSGCDSEKAREVGLDAAPILFVKSADAVAESWSHPRLLRVALGRTTLLVLSRILVVLALLYLLASLLIYGFLPDHHSLAFPLLAEPPRGEEGLRIPTFADLRWVTAHSECGVSMNDLASGVSVGCGPFGRKSSSLTYPPMSILVARFLAVKGQHTGLLGFSFGVAVITILALLNRRLVKPEWFANGLLALVLLGFPLQLALERANIDSVIFLLLAALAAVSCLTARWAALPAAGLAWLVVAIKMYPFVGITAWYMNSWRDWRRRPWLALAVIAGTGAGVASVLRWYRRSGGTAVQTINRDIGHGLIVPQMSTQLPLSWLHSDHGPLQIPIQPLLAIGLVLLAWLCWRRLGLHRHWLKLVHTRAEGFERHCLTSLPSLLALVWLACYFLSGSYDYRLILALPALIACSAILTAEPGLRPPARAALALILLGVIYGWFAPLFPPSSLPFRLNLVCDLVFMPLLAGTLLAMVAAPLTGVQRGGTSPPAT